MAMPGIAPDGGGSRTMCGLIGWMLPTRRSPGTELLRELTDRLAHRGPDAAGSLHRPVLGGDWTLALGHRRLSILDLSDAGTQPFESDDIALAYNGEIYNFIELRGDLEALGHRFETATDTEVLLRAWRQWGAAALPRLRGMFAFALWDARARELVLARDPFGKKPLYLMPSAGGLIFGSEIGPLTRFPGFDRTLDLASVDEYFQARYVPGPHTFFRAIQKLPPGHLGRWRDGKLQLERYFTPPVAHVAPGRETFAHNVERLAAGLDEAVRIRMRSDAPFGAFLSGGLDSSTIVALMAAHSSRPVRTFAVGFAETDASELPYADRVAERFGCDHHALIVRPSDVIDRLPEAIAARGAPVSEPSDVAILALSHQARASVKMVLTGEGSDELLGGYPKHRVDRHVGRYQALVPAALHRALIAPLAGWLPYRARKLKLALDALGEQDPARYQLAWFGLGEADLTRASLGHNPAPPRNPWPFEGAAAQSRLRRMLFFDQTSWLPDNLLERGDRMMMAGSIEGRMPFMDVALAELVATFPDRHLTGAPGAKAVLRAAAARWLDRVTLERPKVGFRVPVEAWFRADLASYLEDLLLGEDAQVSRLLERQTIVRILALHRDGRRNLEKMIWTLLNFELFLRAFRPDFDAR